MAGAEMIEALRKTFVRHTSSGIAAVIVFLLACSAGAMVTSTTSMPIAGVNRAKAGGTTLTNTASIAAINPDPTNSSSAAAAMVLDATHVPPHSPLALALLSRAMALTGVVVLRR